MLLVTLLNRESGEMPESLRTLATFPSDDLLVPNGGTYLIVIGHRADTFVMARDFNAALRVWETGTAATRPEWHRLAARAMINVLSRNVAGAQLEANKAVELLEARLRELPEDVRSLRALSWVYLALDRKTDALKIAQQTVELLPPEKDAALGAGNLTALAEIQAQTGAGTEAVQNLKKLLSMPAGETVSIGRLKVDPVWDPIRNDRGFQQLLTMKEHIGP
jgi:tetratricopeptide (TPR) repeat protein